MNRHGIIEVFGLAMATPVVAALLFSGLCGMAWYGKTSGWAAARTRTTPTTHLVAPFVAPFVNR